MKDWQDVCEFLMWQLRKANGQADFWKEEYKALTERYEEEKEKGLNTRAVMKAMGIEIGDGGDEK